VKKKQPQNERTKAIGIIVGSQIIGLIQTMNDENKKKGSTITFRDHLRKYVWNADTPNRQKYARVCYDSLLHMLDQTDQSQRVEPVAIATIVESLSFSFESEFREFFGDDYFVKMCRFVDKQSEFEGMSEFAKRSYEISDMLRDSVRKFLFETFKDAKSTS